MNNPSYRPGQRRFSKIEEVTLTVTGEVFYAVRAGTTHISIQMWGAGGGGGGGRSIAGRGTTTYYGGGGGGAGGYTYKVLTEDFKKEDRLNFTIGAGGNEGGFGASGSAGGTTSLDSYERNKDILFSYSSVNATGGGGGGVGSGFGVGVGGSAGSSNGGISPSASGNSGGNGSAGAVDTTSNGGAGGAPPMIPTPLSNAGFYFLSYSAASAGSEYGHGGGGGVAGPIAPDSTGGDGAAGAIIVSAWGYYPPVPVDPNLAFEI
jgi:hypothetical protein